MPYTSPRLNKLKHYVFDHIQKSDVQDPAHGKDHIMRVYELGMQIGIKEKANLEVLGASLLLHDVIRPTDARSESTHALDSARFAKEILPNFGYSEKEIEDVINAIEKSSRSGGSNQIPETIEAKIVYDADKADGAGKIGIERAKTLWRKRFELEKKPYDERIVARWYLLRAIDILKTQPGFTETGKRILAERGKISIKYCKDVLGDDFNKIIDKELGDKKYY